MRDETIKEEEQIANEREQGETPLGHEVLKQRLQDLPDIHPALPVNPSTSVQDVIQTMRQSGLDGVLVVEDDQVVGVCTSRDIVTQLADSPGALDQLPIGNCMCPRPECLTPETEIAYALHHMHVNDAQLIPIIDSQEQPIGVVTMQDIIGHLASLFPQQILNLPSVPSDMFPPKPEGA